MPDIAANLERIKQAITESEQKFARKPGSVRLLAACKKQSVEKILMAIAAGQTIFGENYLQEALPKMAAIAEQVKTPIEWHFIGPLQSNKTRKIAEHFAWVQSVSTTHIADRLNEQRPAHLPPLNICIEVNLDAETTKSGANPAEVKSIMTYCSALPRLKVRGLMSIPQIQHGFDAQRRDFHQLNILWNELRDEGFDLDTLSIGMTDDFAAAIAEGSTMVRIGTGIFGPRAI